MTSPHDIPDARALVEAVREFLQRDVIDSTEGRVRFHTRVAINALGIVERELQLAESQERTHRERLARLGFETDAELAAAIRDGALDGRLDELFEALRETVAAKLAVANPSYLSPPI